MCFLRGVDMCTHIPTLTNTYTSTHTPYTHLRLHTQTDGQIDIYGRNQEQKTEDGSVKMNDLCNDQIHVRKTSSFRPVSVEQCHL